MWSAETVVACALALLTRSEASFPPIEFVEHPPAVVSPNAEGFVRVGERRIYLVTSSPVFRRARQAMYRCGDIEAHRKLASVLVHEEWHVKHGADEVQAYMTQLLTLIRLGGRTRPSGVHRRLAVDAGRTRPASGEQPGGGAPVIHTAA